MTDVQSVLDRYYGALRQAGLIEAHEMPDALLGKTVVFMSRVIRAGYQSHDLVTRVTGVEFCRDDDAESPVRWEIGIQVECRRFNDQELLGFRAHLTDLGALEWNLFIRAPDGDTYAYAGALIIG